MKQSVRVSFAKGHGSVMFRSGGTKVAVGKDEYAAVITLDVGGMYPEWPG